MSFTIQTVLVPVQQGYDTADVHIQHDRIAAIGTNLAIVGTAIDGRNKLLLPGFVNAHTHSSEMWQRGMIPPVPLELWIAEYDFASLNVDQIYLSALGTAVETLLSGGTSVVDHLVLIPGKELETVAAAVRAYRQIGIRAFIAPLIQDEPLRSGLPTGGLEPTHSPYLRSTEATLELMQDVVNQFHKPDEGTSVMVAPTGTQLCSDQLFEGCGELSDRYRLCRHAHLLETKAQKLLNAVSYAWVNGNAVVQSNNIVNFDLNELRRELLNRSEWSTKRRSPTLADVEAHYRAVMNLPRLTDGYS